ncbi:MAG: clostripain-related cysteine peptidase [Bacteroidota bacterium]
MNTAMRWRVASAFTSAAGLLLVVVTAAGCFGGTTQRMGSVDGYVFKPAGYGSAAATAATADPARGVATEATSAAAASVGTGPNANASPGAVGGPAAITATAAARGLRVGPAGPRGAPPTGYEPCAGAVVSVTGSTGVARTDANGYFRKDGVSPGTQTVSIVYEPFRLETRVIVRSGQVTTVNQTTGSLLGKWTIMVYMCADNNLESAAIADMNELEEVGSTSDVNILVQIDRAKGYDTSNYDWPTTRRYYITPDSNAPGSPDYDTIVSPMASWDENDTEVNMADPAELRDFVAWCMANYPAQHYVLVLWNHGDGWTIWRSPRLATRAICVDDESGQALDVDQIRVALEGLPRLDIIGFDACLMQMAEVAYEVRGVADVAVGSEEVEPEGGWDYSRAFADVCADPYATSAWDVATAIVDSYIASYAPASGVTQSALRLEDSDDIAMAVRGLKDQLVYWIEQNAGGTDAARIREAIRSARLASREYYYATSYFDLKDFAGRLGAGIADPASGVSGEAKEAICAKADVLLAALSGPWLYAGGPAGAAYGNGLSIYLPDRETWAGVHGYDCLQFEQYTRWSDVFQYVDP